MSQSSTANQGSKAKDLPCIFLDLVRYYSDQGLNVCGMPKSEHWRNANAPAAARKLEAFQDLIPELRDQQFSQFSICVNHYNQVIANDNFYQHLLDSSSRIPQLDVSSNTDEAVVDDVSRHLFEFERVAEHNRYVITELQRQVQNKNRVISRLNERLEECHRMISQLEELYQEQYEAYQRQQLTEQWNSRYDNQHKRIQAVIDIALIERESLYND
ncbi:10196_t:CDS:2, partial [Ambispora leptoticha]